MVGAGNQHRAGLEEKLFTVRRKVARESHIKVEEAMCRQCSGRICTYVCPAQVYVWDESEERIDIRHENCLECGACWVSCELYAIEWSNPVWGTGISYKDS